MNRFIRLGNIITATAPGKTKPVAFYLNLAEEKPNE